jgi:hypothetical protein
MAISLDLVVAKRPGGEKSSYGKLPTGGVSCPVVKVARKIAACARIG